MPSSLTTFLTCFQAALESSAVTLWVRAERPLAVLLSLGALRESTWSACHLYAPPLSAQVWLVPSRAHQRICVAYLPGGAAYAVAIFRSKSDHRPGVGCLPRSHAFLTLRLAMQPSSPLSRACSGKAVPACLLAPLHGASGCPFKQLSRSRRIRTLERMLSVG